MPEKRPDAAAAMRASHNEEAQEWTVLRSTVDRYAANHR
jgi:hypothetical protein